jgi:hypothetical protein
MLPVWLVSPVRLSVPFNVNIVPSNVKLLSAVAPTGALLYVNIPSFVVPTILRPEPDVPPLPEVPDEKPGAFVPDVPLLPVFPDVPEVTP